MIIELKTCGKLKWKDLTSGSHACHCCHMTIRNAIFFINFSLKVVRRIPVLNVILKASETVSLKSNEVANRRRGSGRQTQSHSSKLKPRPHHAHSTKSQDSKTRNPSK